MKSFPGIFHMHAGFNVNNTTHNQPLEPLLLKVGSRSSTTGWPGNWLRDAGPQAPPRPAESEPAFQQGSQAVPGHIQVWKHWSGELLHAFILHSSRQPHKSGGLSLWTKNAACHISKQRILQPSATTAARSGEPWGNSGWKQKSCHQAISRCSHRHPSSAPWGDSGWESTGYWPQIALVLSKEWFQWAQTLASSHT